MMGDLADVLVGISLQGRGVRGGGGGRGCFLVGKQTFVGRSIEGVDQGLSQDPACLLDRQFPKNLLFGQANIFMKNFQFRLFGGNNQIFPKQTIF